MQDCIPVGNKPLLLVLVYKELCPVLAEQRLAARAEPGVEAEPEAEAETDLQTATCRCGSSTQATPVRRKLAISPF